MLEILVKWNPMRDASHTYVTMLVVVQDLIRNVDTRDFERSWLQNPPSLRFLERPHQTWNKLVPHGDGFFLCMLSLHNQMGLEVGCAPRIHCSFIQPHHLVRIRLGGSKEAL